MFATVSYRTNAWQGPRGNCHQGRVTAHALVNLAKHPIESRRIGHGSNRTKKGGSPRRLFGFPIAEAFTFGAICLGNPPLRIASSALRDGRVSGSHARGGGSYAVWSPMLYMVPWLLLYLPPRRRFCGVHDDEALSFLYATGNVEGGKPHPTAL